MSTRSVLVIGGGIIGTASAYYLAKRGWNVTLVDRDRHGMGCSHANCGFISPSHVLPLAEPGAIRKALAMMFRARAPLYIKPRLDLELWVWLYRFARRCNTADMLEAGRACAQLLIASRQLYNQLVEEHALACEFESKGCLFVYRSKGEWENFAGAERLVRERFGIAGTRLDPDALVEKEPALKPGAAGGWFYPADAHLRPDKLLRSWREVLARMGVTILEQCPVEGFARDGQRARAALTPRGPLEADAFVIAAGALTPEFNEHLGAKIPIQPGKGYSLTMPRPAVCPATPIIFTDDKVAVTPMQSAYRLGSTMEFSGYDTTLNRRRLDALKAAARRYLHEPYSEPIEKEWYGWRPMTFDGMPIIDRAPAMSNVTIAAGHNMLGLSMAPGSGLLVAQLLSGEPPHIDPRPYRLSRFNH
jgi:D-amino-acid dehydrogenase